MKKLLSLFVPLLALILALPQSAWATSPARSVDVYQNATKSITKILYYLPTNEKGNDNKYYSAIDMGYGVAWADKNIGADAEDEAGTYFYWGDIEGHTTFSSSQALDVSSGYTLGTELSVELDAAYKKIGSDWRIPTPDDFIALRDNTIKTNNEKFTSNAKDNYIIIPGKGGYEPTNNLFYNGWQHYWTNTFAGKTSRYGVAQIFTRTGDNDYYVQNKLADDENYARCYYGMPIRAIYKPSFTIRTLTIHIKNGEDMVYKCEDGQTISVTAVANTAEKYVFDKWSDNNSTSATRDFVMTGGDLETTATFKDDPAATTHTVTFKDYDGTTLNTYSLIEGRTPDYRGETISRVGYEFTGWTPSITPLGNADVTYTATYKKQKLFTITNTHGSNASAVTLVRRDKEYGAQPAVNVRIKNSSDVVTSDWTTITVYDGSKTSFSLGSIPAGGKMEIYGDNSGGFGATPGGSNSYYTTFNFSGGTIELSGNILSLVACSDGESIDNSFTLPDYCFNGLFYGATAIVNAEDLELPSMTLSLCTYRDMFHNCTGMITPPKTLPATTMTSGCYNQMFYGCTAMTQTPDVCGSTASGQQSSSSLYGSMNSMFNACTNLTKIRIYLAGWYDLNSYYTHGYWCGAVASNTNIASDGVLYCPPTLERKFGAQGYANYDWCHYMPQGNSTHWSTIYSYNITFVAKGGNWSDATSYNKQFTWKTDVSDVNSFLDTESPEGYYTDAACTTPITITEIRALLGTQQEDDVETTKYIYAKFASSSTLTVTVASNNTAFGTVNESAINGVESGTGITVSGSTLTIGSTTVTAKKHADDAQYTYTFTGWTDDKGKDLPESVTDDLTIRANFTQTLNNYTVTWKDEDGTTLKTDASVAYGATPSFGSENPTKTADVAAEGYTYTFNAWTPAITTVTGNATYTASYTPHKKQYSLVWDVNGGNALTGEYTHGDNIEWGTPITAPADPTKDGFDFAGWDATPASTMPAANTTYTAQWTAQSDEFELVDDKYEGDAWYTTLANLAGKPKNVTYKRTMAANQWNVVSLPFDFNLWENQKHAFNGCIYAFEGAEYDNGSLNFNFVSVSFTMTANTPYVFYSGTKAENVRFEGVEIKAQKADNTTYVTDGKVQFRNTIVRENLSPDGPDKRKVYIYGNRLYYPNNDATWMRAFRGYFYLDMTDEEIKHVQPRMRIISGGQVTTELELVPDKADDGVRKYIENGIMVIERNGVRYNAQGAKID